MSNDWLSLLPERKLKINSEFENREHAVDNEDLVFLMIGYVKVLRHATGLVIPIIINLIVTFPRIKIIFVMTTI